MPNDVAGPTLARLQAPWRQPGGGATLARWARPGSALTVQPAWGEAPALRKASLLLQGLHCFPLPAPTGTPSRLTPGPPQPLPDVPRSPGIKQKQPWAKYNFI